MNNIQKIIDINKLEELMFESVMNRDYEIASALKQQERFLLSPDGEKYIIKTQKENRLKKINKII